MSTVSTGYTGVRVIDVQTEHIGNIYKQKQFELIRNSDDTFTLPFDKRHKLFANEFIVLKDIAQESTTALTRVEVNQNKSGILTLNTIEKDYPHGISKLKPRNKEQSMALDVLLDDNIPIVTLTGRAGTGKTLLALVSALAKMDSKAYSSILLTKPMSWVGKHGLGALPGEVEDKFNPYLENYMCNIQHILGGKSRISDLIDQYNVEFLPLQLIRGASWHNKIVIADEIQTLDFHEMVTLGTRLGEGSKIILMGDLGQRDEKIAKEKTGLYKFINHDKAKKSPLVANIELWKCERSPTAALFADVFEV